MAFLRSFARLSPAVAGSGAALCLGEKLEDKEAPPVIHSPPGYIRDFSYARMQRRWPSDAEGLKGVPKRSWPDVQPEASEIPLLKAALEACVNEKGVAGCDDVLFTLATACVGDKDSAETGLQLYYEAAKRGHADSMCALGQCHELGFGVKANDKLAFRWYEQAAVKHEHANAMYELGVLYFIGDSVEEDERQAVELFLAAAKQGHAGAMYLLGDCLLEGAGGIAKDKDKALRWLIHAGDAGAPLPIETAPRRRA